MIGILQENFVTIGVFVKILHGLHKTKILVGIIEITTTWEVGEVEYHHLTCTSTHLKCGSIGI